MVLGLEMASFPSKVSKISLSEILLLRCLHVTAGEGSGVWSLSVKAVMVQKHSALCAKQEGPFSLCVSASVQRCFSCSLRTAQCLLSVFLLLIWTNRLQCTRALEAVNQWIGAKKEGEVAGSNMVRGRQNNARGKIFMINGDPQSGRLMLEEGDCMRLDLDTERTEVTGIRPWYLSHLLIYLSVFYRGCPEQEDQTGVW